MHLDFIRSWDRRFEFEFLWKFSNIMMRCVKDCRGRAIAAGKVLKVKQSVAWVLSNLSEIVTFQAKRDWKTRRVANKSCWRLQVCRTIPSIWTMPCNQQLIIQESAFYHQISTRDNQSIQGHEWTIRLIKGRSSQCPQFRIKMLEKLSEQIRTIAPNLQRRRALCLSSKTIKTVKPATM